ncbi:hypothetical protein WI80_14305 [Burkholderia ubonensis]|nr:hypothetical protein WI80_14305 [Burkholderia ubonensis]KVU24410.1 hypothetical protein WK63_26870 [Burkholderia ubonensis]
MTMSEKDNAHSAAAAAKAFEAGVVAHRSKSFAVAEQRYREVIAILPGHAEAHNNIGILLEIAGRIDEAETHYRRALSSRPGYIEAHCNLGLLMHSEGRMAEAERCYRQALSLDSECVIAHNKLGLVLQLAGRRSEAERHFRHALMSAENDVDALANLGALLHEDGRYQESETLYREAIVHAPQLARVHQNLGVLLHKVGRQSDAEDCLRRAISLDSNHSDVYGSLGNLLYDQQRFSEAEACYRAVLEQMPSSVEAVNNLGRVLQDSGRFAEAEQCFRRALALAPERHPTAFNLGLVLLAMGRYEEGWQLYEARYGESPYWGEDASCHVRPRLPYPEWRGEPIDGKSLIVLPEQGLGDFLHFCRYLPLLKARGVRRLSVVCPVALRRLAESIEGVDSCYTPGEIESLPAHDFACLLMSLPMRFATTLRSIPSDIPYVRPRDDLVSHWNARLPAHGFKVGLVWAGDSRPDQPSANAIDRRRSFHASTYLPLLALKGATFVSLQKGEAARCQLFTLPGELRPVDFMDEVTDFADTAAIVANLDLVVTVDTSVAHVAGALGKPVWILSRFDGCWRWLSNRDDSPWYPTARLFRQRSPGAWMQVVEEVAAELRERIA